MVKLIKRAMYAKLNNLKKSLNEESFLTIVTVCENIVNDRPLTYISPNPQEYKVITPNHLLRPLDNVRIGPPLERPKNLQSYWHLVNDILNQIWTQFIKEYVPTLHRVKTKWLKNQRDVKTGDLVAVIDHKVKGRWPLALVVKTYKDKDDNKVRFVDIKRQMSENTFSTKIDKRHVSSLMLLLPADEMCWTFAREKSLGYTSL
jgi:hypothetical protein